MRCPRSLATKFTARMRVLKNEWKPPQCAITKSPCRLCMYHSESTHDRNELLHCGAQ